MAAFRDPLSFGSPDDDDDGFADLTAQLDRHLTTDPPSHHGYGDLGDSTTADLLLREPFDAFSAAPGAAPQQHGDSNHGSMDPLASYGSLVTPAAPQQQQQPQQQQPQQQQPQQQQQATESSSNAGPLPTPSPLHAPGPAASPLTPSPDLQSHHQQQQQQQQQQEASASASPAPAINTSHPSSMPHSRIATPEHADGVPSPSGAIAASRAPAADAPLHVRVTDPQKRDAGGLLGIGGGHIEYLVSTKLLHPPPGYSRGPEFSVRRRFNHFVALADLLKARYRGYFVPPRPDKNAVEGQRQSEAFLEERRVSLERYLNRLAAHPAIGLGEELRLFLEADGDLSTNHQWLGLAPPAATLMEGTAKLTNQLIGRESKVVDPVEAAQPAARSRDLLRAMREAAQNMRAKNAVAAGGVVGDDGGEAALAGTRDKMDVMKEQLTATSRAAEKLIGCLDAVANVHGDLGLSLFKVAKFEETQGAPMAAATGTVRHHSSLIGDQKRTAAALVRLHKMLAKACGRTAVELGPLHDTLALMPSVLKGLTSREHALLTHHTLEADLDERKRTLAALEAGTGGKPVFGGDKAKSRRMDDLRLEVSRLELSIGAARAEYEKVRGANSRELERFGKERSADYIAMMENFAATQVAASERVLDVWLQLATELGADQAQLAAVRVAVPAGGIAVGSSA